MFINMIVASLLAACCLAKQIKNGAHYGKTPQSGVQPLLDGGFYPFNFGKGNMGLEVDRFFLVNVPQTPEKYGQSGPAIGVIDCFCGGDTFDIYDNGVKVGMQGARPDNANSLCSIYHDTPSECVGSLYNNEGIYASVVYALTTPGLHNITIKTGNSPFGAGTAFLFYYTAILDASELNFVPVCFVEGGFNYNSCYLDVAPF